MGIYRTTRFVYFTARQALCVLYSPKSASAVNSVATCVTTCAANRTIGKTITSSVLSCCSAWTDLVKTCTAFSPSQFWKEDTFVAPVGCTLTAAAMKAADRVLIPAARLAAPLSTAGSHDACSNA